MKAKRAMAFFRVMGVFLFSDAAIIDFFCCSYLKALFGNKFPHGSARNFALLFGFRAQTKSSKGRSDVIPS